MAKEKLPAETPDGKAAANIGLGELGQMLKKRRASAPAKKPDATTPKPAKSEQSDGEGEAESDDALSQTANQEPEAEGEQPEGEGSGEDTTGGDAEGEAEGEGEGEPEKPEKKGVQARIDTLTRQKMELREENQELRGELREMRDRLAALERDQPEAKQPEHPAAATFTADRDVRQLDSQIADMESFLKFARDNPEGGEFEENGKTYQMGADQVKAYSGQAERQLRRLEAKREARLETLRVDFDTQRRQSHDKAVKLYPWIEKKDSPEFQDAVAILRENKGLMARPDFELVVARMVVGSRLEQAAVKKGGKPSKPSSTPPPVVTHTPNAAPTRGQKPTEKTAEEKQFGETGRVGDLGKLLAQRRQVRKQTAQAA